MKITDFTIEMNGIKVPADPFGNNAAFCCSCGHPVVIITRDENQRGMKRDNPAVCRGCDDEYVVISIDDKREIVILQKL